MLQLIKTGDKQFPNLSTYSIYTTKHYKGEDFIGNILATQHELKGSLIILKDINGNYVAVLPKDKYEVV